MFTESFEKVAISPLHYAKAALKAVSQSGRKSVSKRLSSSMARSGAKGQVRQNAIRSQALKPSTLQKAQAQSPIKPANLGRSPASSPAVGNVAGDTYRQDMMGQWKSRQRALKTQNARMVGGPSPKSTVVPYKSSGKTSYSPRNTPYINL